MTKVSSRKHNEVEPAQFYKMVQGGCQKIVSPLQLYSHGRPIAESINVESQDVNATN